MAVDYVSGVDCVDYVDIFDDRDDRAGYDDDVDAAVIMMLVITVIIVTAHHQHTHHRATNNNIIASSAIRNITIISGVRISSSNNKRTIDAINICNITHTGTITSNIMVIATRYQHPNPRYYHRHR